MALPRTRLIEVVLDRDTMGHGRPDFDRDRDAAIGDLVLDNSFILVGDTGGPYKLRLGSEEGRLLFDVSGGREHPLRRVRLSLQPFRRVIRDYIELCEVHYDAMRTMSPSKVEAMDMGRRGLHNEASELLQARLKGKIETDLDTARRLFTLICALHWRG